MEVPESNYTLRIATCWSGKEAFAQSKHKYKRKYSFRWSPMVEVAMIFTGLKGKSQQLQNCRSICRNISLYISIRSKWKKLRKNNLEWSNMKPHKNLDKSSFLQLAQLFNFVSSIHGICWTVHFWQLYRDHWQYQSRNCSGSKSAGSPGVPLV